MNIFTGIGLGPGDPELITVKAIKALEAADVIFYPATSIKDGEVRSFSLNILKQLDLKVDCRPLLIPMTGKNREKRYRDAYRQVKNEMDKGKKVVVVNEGDVLFYSTFGYLFEMARSDGKECRVIPGIPAFIAAAGAGTRPLADGKAGLQVMAAPESFNHIRQFFKQHPKDTLVVMKMKLLDGWCDFINECQRPFLYVEKMGTKDEYVTSDSEHLRNRDIPYFSLIIFYPEEEKIEVEK